MTKTNWENQLTQDTISFAAAFKGGVVILVVAAVALGVGAWMNWQRQEKITQEYTLETQRYLAKNEPAVRELFTTVFDDCQQEYLATRSSQTHYSDISCQAAKTHFSVLNLDQLKDSSAIAFLKEGNSEQYALIEASGNYRSPQNLENAYFISWDNRDDLRRYLQLHQEITLWDDFLNYIPGKEVFIPIEYEGHRYGYIFRGVIEKQ